MPNNYKRVFLFYILLIVVLLSSCQYSASYEVIPNLSETKIYLGNDQIISWDFLTANYNDKFIIRRAPNSERIKSIKGNFYDKQINNKEEAAKLLYLFSDIFEIKDFSYNVTINSNNDNTKSFVLQQIKNGVIVEGGKFIITTSQNGYVKEVSGLFVDVSQIDTRPKVHHDLYHPKAGEKISSVQLIIDNRENLLCWRYASENRNPIKSCYIYVNALSGEEIYRLNYAIS